MKYNPEIHHRRSIRLKGYDYSQKGFYFITACTQNRACLFGTIINKKMVLSPGGNMVEKEWLKLPERFQNIVIHEFIVMPNHFHGILEIVDNRTTTVGAALVVAPTVTTNSNTEITNSPSQMKKSEIVKPGIQEGNKSIPYGKLEAIVGVTPVGATTRVAPTEITNSIGNIIGAFKSITTVEYIRGVKSDQWPPFNKKLWQRNYFERIIRSEESYKKISEYIMRNPANWDSDALK